MPPLLTSHLRSRGVRALVGTRWELPYRLPRAGSELRLAFVGQSAYFEAAALTDERPEIATIFIDLRPGADISRMLSLLGTFDPHVVIAFQPENMPARTFDDLERAATVGFRTESFNWPNDAAHSNRDRPLKDSKALDAGNFDRLISFGPLISSVADDALVWRSLPLPVADILYADVRPARAKPGVLFVGGPTSHRERFLGDVRQHFDLSHAAHGVDAAKFRELLAQTDVGINLHRASGPSFEHRVCLHLAAGQLLISEPLSPTHGLEAGVDFLKVQQPRDLFHAILTLHRYPGTYDRIRYSGRAKAETYRASHVYPRLLHDLYLDLAAFGTRRRAAQR